MAHFRPEDIPPHLRSKTTKVNLPQPDRESEFRGYWEHFTAGRNVPPLESQLVLPGRKFRFDFGFTPYRVAIEINGGIFKSKGGHNSINGLIRDYEKLRHAALCGWAVLPYDTKTLGQSPGACIDEVLCLLALRGWRE